MLGLLLLRLFVPEAGFVGGPAGVVPGFDEEATKGRRIVLASFVRVRGGIYISLSLSLYLAMCPRGLPICDSAYGISSQ